MPEKPVDPDLYRDTQKSVIISAPAGSGKTEKLARRYISLLETEPSVEKILCITFTEKAAAEMKERILNILESEMPELMNKVRPSVPLMRISTIHAFCLKILKRFSIELDLDPSLEVMDEHKANDLWGEAIFDTLLAERNNHGVMFDIMRDSGIKGWGPLKRHLDMLAGRAPLPEIMLLSSNAHELVEGDTEQGIRVMTAYAKCLEQYQKLKRDQHLLDFNDLEVLAARALNTVPNAQDILYSFDEHTDHILVDEFQDTSSLQWSIIDKLTEEWRSGKGLKREKGKTPTIFLVGDEKQSIYLFRGANVTMFAHARKRFNEWLPDEFHYIEATENYRCLPRIVDFTNRIFDHLMVPDDTGWATGYTGFDAKRTGDGFVGYMNINEGVSSRETRLNEAGALARHIRSLHNNHQVYGHNDKLRACSYEDMAILLKSRTHLTAYEDALRHYGIPFIVIKGIGFFNEPEVALLRDLVCFIVSPSDSFALFNVLRSPMFGMDFSQLHALSLTSKDSSLFHALSLSKVDGHADISNTLGLFIDEATKAPLAHVIENALTETAAWRQLCSNQRLANIRKFISIVEGYQSTGLSPLEIREKLLSQRGSDNAPKANISAEGMDAVRIMTIHASKGLQFPMVFLPGMDERIGARSQPIVFDDSGSVPRMGFEQDNKKRKKIDIFMLDSFKQLQEEKRLFYVAVTRARDYLLMTGSSGEKPKGRLTYLEEAFGLFSDPLNPDELPLDMLFEDDIADHPILPQRTHSGDTASKSDMPVYTEKLDHMPAQQWRDVTETDETYIKTGHGKDATVIGTIIHRLLEDLSRGKLTPSDVPARAARLISDEAGQDSQLATITSAMKKLTASAIMKDIVLPMKNAHTELPFILRKDEIIYKGRIDRVIIDMDNDMVNVYDYKTYPIDDDDIEEAVNDHRTQMEIYREAAGKLFGLPARAYLVLTDRLEIVEIT